VTDGVTVDPVPEWLASALDWWDGGGRVRPAIRAPDPSLSIKGDAVDPVDGETCALAGDLLATMGAAPACIGLAAAQVGVAARIFAVDVRHHAKARTCHGRLVLCNAAIVAASQWQKGREGCLSVPDLTGDVKRAGRLVVTGELPGTGRTVTMATDAFEARAVQHEIDHCAGRLFLDRVASPHAVFARTVYR
jgi:peptide deformylase